MLPFIQEAFRLIHHTHQKKKPPQYFLTSSPEEEEEKEAGSRSQAGTPLAIMPSSSSAPGTPITSQAVAGGK